MKISQKIKSISEHANTFIPSLESTNVNVGKSERIMSVIAGTVLAVIGIRSWKRGFGKTLGMLGGLLLKRGVTGYCEINNKLKRNTAQRNVVAADI